MIRRSLAPVAVVAAIMALALPVRAAEFTEVIDAFDEGDPFDLSLSFGYSRTLSMGNLTRECFHDPSDTTSRNGYCPEIVTAATDFPTTVDVLRYTHVKHVLNIEVLVGLYHDLNLKLALPIIISDTRQLTRAKGVDEGAANTILRDDATGNQLFHVPFTSPNRSGIDQFGVGLEWAIFNQERDETKPTWTIFVEGWFAVGDIIEAGGSYKDAGTEIDLGDSKNVSQGVHVLHVGTKVSRRFKYLDPYFGFMAWIPFPKKGESPWPFGDKYSGQINDMPPIVGAINFGAEIIPWENVTKEQKFYIDLRIIGTYHSEGREVTPLFDALGTSEDEGLSYSGSEFDQFWSSYPKYRWTGLTDVENYGSFAGRLTLGFITGKWFKIQTGVMFAHDQEHFLTFTDECNPANFDAVGMLDGTSNCEWDAATGTQEDEDSYNPDFRRAIDSLGNRFRVEESTIFEFFIMATAMF
ncbi:MAG: hypothetical protein JRG91_02415 [Deltaproteobacteria bacterium]|nr:hypothetical protein [Deltaproteobacteria bacterium]